MLSHHLEHFYINHQKSNELPEQIGAHALGAFSGHWRIIALFVWFSKCHNIFYSGTTFQNGLALAL